MLLLELEIVTLYRPQALLVLLEELLEELQETELSFQQGKQVSEPRRRRVEPS